MNTFDYTLLIKDKAKSALVKKMVKLKNYIFWTVFFLCMATVGGLLSALESGNLVSLVLIALVETLFSVAAAGYFIFFPIYFKRLTDAQETILDPSDENDRVFLAMTKKYREHRQKELKTVFIAAGICAAEILAAIIAGALVPSAFEGGGGAALVGILVFAAVFAGTTICASFKNTFSRMKFVKESMGEIEFLRNFQYARDGLTKEEISKKKLKIFDMTDSQKMTDYLYPNREIQKKVTAMSIYTVAGGGVLGVFAVVGLFLFGSEAEKGNFTPLAVCAAVFLVLFIALTVFLSFRGSKYQKLQEAEFQKNPEYFRFHIELAAANKKYRKVSQAVEITVAAAWVCACTAAAFFGGEAFLSAAGAGFIFVWLTSVAWVLAAYPSYRKKARPIEAKINAHLAAIKANGSGGERAENHI
ncbi:MAG: hypothetical protein LBP62_01590 [Clostridiales bacterium]|jgi:hypothetical protein|nr:hypothetical protein [Clostridiales bacterium]